MIWNYEAGVRPTQPHNRLLMRLQRPASTKVVNNVITTGYGAVISSVGQINWLATRAAVRRRLR